MGNKKTIYQHEPTKRREVIKKLEGYLLNPGRFSVLVLGLHGTGKTHWLHCLQEAHKELDCLSGIISVNARLAQDERQDYWQEKIQQASGKLLLIEDVEKLSQETQEILFEGISTDRKGRVGFGKKEVELRVAFTSTYDIKTLRDTDQLSNKFFDRIAQFVVRFPTYLDTKSEGVWQDFLESWKKMNFQEQTKPPHRLKDWVEYNAYKFNGNFRDLDKIIINWHNCRLIKMPEGNILSYIQKEFEMYLHYPSHSTVLPEVFYLNEKENYDANLQKFRAHYKAWLIKEYGNLKKGAKHAGKSYRTMEGW